MARRTMLCQRYPHDENVSGDKPGVGTYRIAPLLFATSCQSESSSVQNAIRSLGSRSRRMHQPTTRHPSTNSDDRLLCGSP